MQELESFTVSIRESLLWHLQNPGLQGYQNKVPQLLILTLIMRFHKLTLTVKSLHPSGLLNLQKKRLCVYRRQSAKTFPWATTSRKGSSFAFCTKCSHDINLGTGVTRDLRRHQEMKLHKHSEKDGVGVLPLQSYFGPIREESVIHAEVLFTYFLGEHHLAFQLRDHCTKLFKFVFPDSSIAKDFKCSRTKATAVLKVIP